MEIALVRFLNKLLLTLKNQKTIEILGLNYTDGEVNLRHDFHSYY